jgi:hypothetical protein
MNPAIAPRRHAKEAQHQHGGNAQRGAGSQQHLVNVGDFERQMSMIAGTALTVYGLFRGSFSGLALAAIGGALIWRGHTGHCEVYHMLGHSSADMSDHADNHPPQHEQREHYAYGQYDESHAAGDIV